MAGPSVAWYDVAGRRAGWIAWQAVAIGRSRAAQDRGGTGRRRSAKPQSTGMKLTDLRREASGRGVVPPEAKANRGKSRRPPGGLARTRTGERSWAGGNELNLIF